ncbi:hypothetical protein [Limnohabitans sp.]|uniref:hypothetical protein n=1 Tax=Limnohabitans sp. TaxID=1907725 RepID=UPI0039BCB027|nr:hypothetical protein [Comamonadaceae bacterium]
MKTNKVERIFLSGGLIGMLFTNPRKALDELMIEANADGWSAVQILKHSNTNLLITIIQILVLLLTLGLWTWGAGYLVLLEKDD